MKAVNLIPTEQRPTGKAPAATVGRQAPETSAVGAYAIIGALVFAVAAMALTVLAGNDVKKNKAELAQVERDATTVEAQASSLQSFADFKQLSSARVTTVQGLTASRFPWPRALDDVSRALPSDVFISSLDGSTLSGAGSGSSLRGSIQAPSIELSGCTRDQASVARLMSRLRDVRGVTRVSLSKSEASGTSDAAVAPAPPTAADGSTPAVTTEPCPKGSPPTFDLVIFFERAPVGAAAAPNAALGGGPTGPAGAPTGPTGSTGATVPASSTTTTP